jgi:hypothetical protein
MDFGGALSRIYAFFATLASRWAIRRLAQHSGMGCLGCERYTL